MSRGNKRHDARRDAGESEIIEALQKAGWLVWRSLPVDLLCYHASTDTFRTLEVKSPGVPLKPKDGPQKDFCELTGCPIVNNPESAIEAVTK